MRKSSLSITIFAIAASALTVLVFAPISNQAEEVFTVDRIALKVFSDAHNKRN
jgi:hypothetical protein